MSRKVSSIGSALAERSAATAAREAALAGRVIVRQRRSVETAAERTLLEELQGWYLAVVERQAKADQTVGSGALGSDELARRREEEEQWVRAYVAHRLRVMARARRRGAEDATWKAEDALYESSGRVVTVGRELVQ
jgi:hypothetical protein